MKISDKTKNKLIIIALNILRVFLFLLIIFMLLIPLLKVFLDTINASDYSDHYVFIPTKITFRLYTRILHDYFNNRYLLNTILVAGISSILQTIVCGLAGFGFAKLKFKGSNLLFWIIMSSLFLTRESMERPLQWILKYYPLFGINFFGNRNAIFILYMFGAGIKTPIFIYLFRNTFRNMDEEVLDQARIDGCGVINTFSRIAMPLAKDAIFSTMFITFIWEYNDYFLPQFFGYASAGFSTVSLEIAVGRYPFNSNAVAISMLIPVSIVYLLLAKTFFNNISKDKM